MIYLSKLLELEERDKVIADVSHRGGKYGITAETFWDEILTDKQAARFDLNLVPKNIGVYCNYLGGGMRGSITGGGYDKDLPKDIATKIDKLVNACKTRYENIENESGLNTDYPDGDTNWEAKATKSARKSGIVSAY